MKPFIARPFVCANPDKEEVLGIVLDFISNSKSSDIIRPIMRKYGMDTYDSNLWYRAQTLLHSLRDLYTEPGGDEAFIGIGQKLAEEYPFDHGVRTVQDAVLALNQTYHRVHRGIHSEEGFVVNKIQPNILIVTNNTPWPGELVYGMLHAFGRRFVSGRTFRAATLPTDEHFRPVFEVIVE
jgi:hypothetical protein